MLNKTFFATFDNENDTINKLIGKCIWVVRQEIKCLTWDPVVAIALKNAMHSFNFQ